MTDHYHTYLPPIEPGAQRPLWFVLLVATNVGVAVYFWPDRWHPDPVRQRELANAGALFAQGEETKAFAALDSRLLKGSAEAAFLKGLMRYYTPWPDFGRYGVRSWLTEAAEAGYPPAETLLGWALLLDKGCKDCRREAAQWFEKALRRGEDRDARLGLAITWAGYVPFLVNLHVNVILADPVKDYPRLLALAFRNPDLDEWNHAVLIKRAAEEGWSEAQFQYATRFLDHDSAEAMLWLAMAAAQGHADAAEATGGAVSTEIQTEAERRLLAMAADPATYLGKAAQWCGRESSGRVNDKQCRLHALDDHLICRLPRSTIQALRIVVFEETGAYARCRLRRLAIS
jgi:TPR repeat protein